MKNKEFMRKVYRHFGDFVGVAAARELEYLIMDARYTSAFSYRMKEIVEDIRNSGNEIADFSIFFNTNGEIAIIDANIVGRFIGDRYTVMMEGYYKNASLNKIVRSVVNSSDKAQEDFISVSFNVIFETLEILYREITCRKEVLNNIKDSFNIFNYDQEDVSIVAITLLVLEDICRYIGIKGEKLIDLVDNRLQKRYSQEQ